MLLYNSAVSGNCYEVRLAHLAERSGSPRMSNTPPRASVALRLVERVRDLTWETRFEAIADKAPSGLEPLKGAD